MVRVVGQPVRASDEEREATADALRRHYAAGRLEPAELDARVHRALTATTRAELAGLLADLPKDRAGRALRSVYRAQRALLPMHATAFTLGNGALVGVYEVTGGGAFWPGLFLAPTAALLAGHALGSRALRRSLGLPARGERRR